MNIVFSKCDNAVFDDSTDSGLKTIKLGTLLAVDILMKLHNKEAFVQLMQRLNIMYQSHAGACVWFIKWITEQINVL